MTYHQVMPIFRVPRDPPQELSCSMLILDDLDYTTSSFEGFVTEDTDYFIWFLKSLTEPIMDDCPVSGGRLLGDIVHACRASKAHLRLHVDTLQARVRDLEGAATA